jgi:hypothetical protein
MRKPERGTTVNPVILTAIVTLVAGVFLRFRVGAVIFGIAFIILGLVFVIYSVTEFQQEPGWIVIEGGFWLAFMAGCGWFIYKVITAPEWPRQEEYIPRHVPRES